MMDERITDKSLKWWADNGRDLEIRRMARELQERRLAASGMVSLASVEKAIREELDGFPSWFNSELVVAEVLARLAAPSKEAEEVWRKCPQCSRENSIATWEKFGGKCPNCDDLYEREEAASETAEQPVEEKKSTEQPSKKLWERAKILSKTMQCNCDLDNWQPEPSTGHSHVCRIHKAALKEEKQ